MAMIGGTILLAEARGPQYNCNDENRLIDLRNEILREPGEYLDQPQVNNRLEAIMKREEAV